MPPSCLGDQGGQQVLRLDVRIVVADGQALGVGERLLKLGGELVEPHTLTLSGCPVRVERRNRYPFEHAHLNRRVSVRF